MRQQSFVDGSSRGTPYRFDTFAKRKIQRSRIEAPVLTIAIVGSGPSAVYALARLVKADCCLAITIFEQGKTAGVGTPYDPETTSVELLANIASVEIPPIHETFVEFLQRQSAAMLSRLGISSGLVDERAFYPRVALGAYYADQLAQLEKAGRAAGHDITILTSHPVRDVHPEGEGAFVAFELSCGRCETRRFDRVILATGHASTNGPIETVARTILPGDRSIGVIGSSLSAIDIAVSLACHRGAFIEGRYRLGDGAARFHLTLMSRGGRLPEADFFCPLPAKAADGFDRDDVLAVADAAQSGSRLDAVFARFAATLTRLDPVYAERIGLRGLTSDTFAAAYFADRDGSDPFEWARHNLAQVQQDAKRGHVVAWKYAILRMHEPFGSCMHLLDDTERERFRRGLKSVFIDNYAAVPPQSIERLLALHDAGHLSIERLGNTYDTAPAAEGGHAVSFNSRTLPFDRLLDARGQSAAPDTAFPFPTLRALLSANRQCRDDDPGSAVHVGPDYRLEGGLNPLPSIYCLSLPFLLARQPFVQGLTSVAEMGRMTADAILRPVNAKAPEDEGDDDIIDLATIVAHTSPVFMMSTGQVLLTAK